MAQSADSMRSAPTSETTSTRNEVDTVGYWRANLRLIAILLAIWFAVSYLPVLVVNLLNQFNILTGFPFGYYMGSQGSLIVFVLLIFYYSWRMAKIDRQYGLDDD
jgi:putative solute:sodium symporter small subunit